MDGDSNSDQERWFLIDPAATPSYLKPGTLPEEKYQYKLTVHMANGKSRAKNWHQVQVIVADGMKIMNKSYIY